jgi:hypothetical protein
MSAEIPLQEVIMNILALGALKGGYAKIKYSNIFYAFNMIYSEKPHLFKGLFFSTLGNEPYSNTLEDILSSLGTWQIVMVENPRYEYLKVNENICNRIEDDIKGAYGTPMLEDFNHLAQRFNEEIKKRESSVG